MIQILEPKERLRLIDLVEEVGFDVSQWADFKGGPDKAGANPKYCYEWCFQEGNKVIFNLWYEDMIEAPGAIIQNKNFRKLSVKETGVRQSRSKRMDSAMRNAFEKGLLARVIVLKRAADSRKSIVHFRLLDAVPWAVTAYNKTTGDCTITRGAIARADENLLDLELEAFSEGEQKKLFKLHRKREARLRKLKLEKYATDNGGKLSCEVPRCGFDFFDVYGKIGSEYAQVHHKLPLHKAPPSGFKVTFDDLAVVCANCHAMIHRGGACRDIRTLIPVSSD